MGKVLEEGRSEQIMEGQVQEIFEMGQKDDVDTAGHLNVG
jgi:hypothetical protein